MDIQYDNGPMYNYIDAWELKDGTQGEIKYNFAWTYAFYEEEYEEYEDLFWIITWNKNASGVINYTFLWESSDPEYTYLYNWELVMNPNGSGTLDYYWLSGYYHYHYEWDAQGNGSWSYYYGDTYMDGHWYVT